jgi:hypothetical protein
MREARGLHPRRPEDGPGRDHLLAVADLHAHRAVVDADHAGPRADVHAQPLQLPPRRRRPVGRVGRQDAVEGLDEDDPGVGRVDRAEVAPERVVGDLAQRAGQLHPGRASAHHHEGHPLLPTLDVRLAFGGFERDEDPSPDADGVVDRLEARGVRRPVVMPEVGVAGARGDHQRVVRDRAAVREDDPPALGIETHRLAEQDRGVRVAPEDAPQRLGDVARRQRAGRHLVEQRLEQVEVATIDERHRGTGLAAQLPGGVEPPEPTADDDHAAIDHAAFVGHGAGRVNRRGRERPPTAVQTSSDRKPTPPRMWSVRTDNVHPHLRRSTS